MKSIGKIGVHSYVEASSEGILRDFCSRQKVLGAGELPDFNDKIYIM